jgi:Kef-type K+ transport system membrane component KefB
VAEIDFPLLILLVGAATAAAIFIKSGLDRTPVPPLVGYFLLGMLIRLADDRLGFFHEGAEEVFEFLAKVGVVLLLFRIGLESDLKGLLSQLRGASLIWVGNVVISGGLGFWAAFYLLGLALIPSLVVAAAMTATSVGISVAVWERENAVGSENGELLIDVAELDDISAVVLMALLFALLPELQGKGVSTAMLPQVGRIAGTFLLKLIAFGVLCFLFSRYLEPRLTGKFQAMTERPDMMLLVVSIGLMFSAVAGLLEFSLAIGAFFAGLVFSRDPECIKREASIDPLYDLFTPFFFIGIGLNIDPGVLMVALRMGGVLIAAAILGKLLANALPVLAIRGAQGAALIGVSMVPRAEISMIIMGKGLAMGDDVVPARVFSAMVMVSAVTCIGAPLVVRSLLRRWPQSEKGEATQ